MYLIDRSGCRHRITSYSKFYRREFDYQIINSTDEFFGVLDSDGCISESELFELNQLKFIINAENSIFEHPQFCKKLLGWNTKNEIQFLANYFTKQDQILDVGCGWGRLIFPLWKMGYKIDGLEISEKLALYVSKNKPKDATVFLSNMHEFVAIKKYKVAVAAMNTIRYLESYAHLRVHIRNMSLSLTRGGVYMVHTVFLDDCNLNQNITWKVNYKNKEFLVNWKKWQVDYFRKELHEEILIEDQSNHKIYREVQKQLLFSFDDFEKIIQESKKFVISGLFNESYEALSLSENIANGKYWVELRLTNE